MVLEAHSQTSSTGMNQLPQTSLCHRAQQQLSCQGGHLSLLKVLHDPLHPTFAVAGWGFTVARSVTPRLDCSNQVNTT